ncbi:MAG: imidazolonepropionase [Candidatus Bipolaricaulia bacterium]
MLVINIGQLVTPRGSHATGGAAMGELVTLQDAYVKIAEDVIVSVGSMSEFTRPVRERTLDARGGVVIPGLVDPHTHAAFVGSREEEFLARCQGVPYGQGILTTVEQIRAASEEQIYHESKRYLWEMLRMGTTTAEVKSGYGLDTPSELKLLRVIDRLRRELPMEIVPTFLGAHAIPDGVSKADYLEEIIKRMIPQVQSEGLAEFCDVFCEKGFFDPAESREILGAAQGAGLGLKIHADELHKSGGSELAAELGAVSADHLLHVSPQGMNKLLEADVVPVLLPGTAFTLNLKYAPARQMIDLGLPVALSTDFNPGTCLIHSMLLIIALAVMKMRMTIEEALTAATLNAAAALARAEQLGSLEPGKRADLVVLDLDNYRQIPYFIGHDRVTAVVAAGQVVYEKQAETSS